MLVRRVLQLPEKFCLGETPYMESQENAALSHSQHTPKGDSVP